MNRSIRGFWQRSGGCGCSLRTAPVVGELMMFLLVNREGRIGLDAARAVLAGGGSALDAVEAGLRRVEADPAVRTVGRGGYPNLLGDVECDAAIMDGRTRNAGAVGALKGFLNAISVARGVMERLPHTFLVGEGAALFARESGAEACELLTADARNAREAWLRETVQGADREAWPDVALADYAWRAARRVGGRDTAVYLARDAAGHLAAGTSTAGWPYKYPGRIGDSPVVGAGLYADDRYGACACTHTGEMAVRSGSARSVVLYMKQGAGIAEACRKAAEDLDDLHGGILGPLILHGIDTAGRHCVMAWGRLHGDEGYELWSADEPDKVRSLEPQAFPRS
ncbi:MAG: asparaginase [Candidatus Eisenbacteria bacterium]|nr:asparaginase [Candidatus Eisenbacteria bacterium]